MIRYAESGCGDPLNPCLYYSENMPEWLKQLMRRDKPQPAVVRA